MALGLVPIIFKGGTSIIVSDLFVEIVEIVCHDFTRSVYLVPVSCSQPSAEVATLLSFPFHSCRSTTCLFRISYGLVSAV